MTQVDWNLGMKSGTTVGGKPRVKPIDTMGKDP